MEVPLPTAGITSSSPSAQLNIRHSRRSFPNLTHLSLAPLSSRFPMDEPDNAAAINAISGAEHPSRRSLDDGGDVRRSNLQQRRHAEKMRIGMPSAGHSYVEGRSAPVTPSILSRSTSPTGTPRLQHSRSHRHRKRSAFPTYAHDGAVSSGATASPASLAHKSKSVPGLAGAGAVTPLKPVAPLKTPTASATSTTSDEWLHRAGLTIAMQAVENKGQSWLMSRASSTSLVQTHSSNNQSAADENTADDPSMFGHRHSISASSGGGGFGSRFGSRQASRQASRHNSRRGSRVGGNKPDLGMTPAISAAAVAAAAERTPSASTAVANASYESFRDGYFGGEDYDLGANMGSFDDEYDYYDIDGNSSLAEPDFVDRRSFDGDYIAGQLAEEEVRRLAASRGAGFGLGGWMDRLIGWTLFKVDEDGEGSDDDADDDADSEHAGYPEHADIRRAVSEAKAERDDKLQTRGTVRVMEPPVSLKQKVSVPPVPAAPGGDVGSGSASDNGEAGGGWKDAAWLLSVASKVVL